MRLSLRSSVAILFGIAGILTTLVIVGGSAGFSSEPASGARGVAPHSSRSADVRRPVHVPLRVRFGQGTVVGARPMVEVRVGNGPKVPVLLDTGSVGLHIDQQGVRLGSGSGVTVTSRRNTIGYVDGMKQSGVVARAKLTIGGVTTRHEVQFGLISHLGCVPQVPRCPGAAGIDAAVAAGSYGIMGVGLSPPL